MHTIPHRIDLDGYETGLQIDCSNDPAIRIAHAIIDNLVSRLRSSVDEAAITKVVWDSHRSLPLDYETHAAAFATAYLRLNFEKAHSALRSCLPIATRVIDVGSGAGPAALAYMVHLSQRRRCHPTFVLVDRSNTQLDLAEELLRQYSQRMAVKIQLERWCGDITRAPTEVPQGDLVLASHVLTEAELTLSSVVHACLQLTRPRGQFVAIERADDPTPIGEISKQAALLRAPLLRRRCEIVAPDPMTHQHRRWAVNLAIVENPPEPWLVGLVSGYFTAWRARDPAILPTVFHPTCTYVEQAGDVPLHGLAEVEAYWHNKVIPQEQLCLSTTSIAYSPSTAIVHFNASFLRHAVSYELNGILRFEGDAESQRVIRLDEWFTSIKR